jgi:hypothetical protein
MHHKMGRRLRLVSNPRALVNSADPTIDHKTGKVSPSILIGSGSGRPIWREIHKPKKAPMKPTTTEISAASEGNNQRSPDPGCQRKRR